MNKDFLSTNLVDDEGEERVVDLNLDGGDVQLVHDIVGVQERQEPRQPLNEETFDWIIFSLFELEPMLFDLLEPMLFDLLESILFDLLEPMLFDLLEPMLFDLEPMLFDLLEPMLFDLLEPMLFDLDPML